MRIVKPLDTVDGPSCPNCGCNAWVVDGDGQEEWWLLCSDPKGVDCIEVLPLPADIIVSLKE